MHNLSILWAKLGWWQVVIAIITLAAFFIDYDVTGNVKFALGAAFFASVAASLALGARIGADIALAVELIVVAAVIFVAGFIITGDFFRLGLILLSVLILIAAFNVEAGNFTSIGKRNVRLSYVAELVIIVLPMLMTIRHWW